jgi:hypothetical protein
MERQTDVVGVLLDHGADPNFLGITPVTPLSVAAEADDLADAELLLEHGADPNAVSTSVIHDERITTTPLGDARSKEMVDLLKSHGATKRVHSREPGRAAPGDQAKERKTERRQSPPGRRAALLPGRASGSARSGTRIGDGPVA